jgi:hypothetical protein
MVHRFRRPLFVLGLPALTALSSVILTSACASSPDRGFELEPSERASATQAALTTSNSDANAADAGDSDTALATKALAELGADVPDSSKRCSQCHSISAVKVRKWAAITKKADDCLAAASTATEKRDCFRKDPTRATSPYAPSSAGLYAAGVRARKVRDILGRELATFRQQAAMPQGGADEDMMSNAGWETVKKWFAAGVPRLDEVLAANTAPTSCTDSISDALKAHVKDMKAGGWAAKNTDANMAMFGCASLGENGSCFLEKTGTSDAFEEKKEWLTMAGTIRTLKAKLPYQTNFFTRISPDGRFVAHGGGVNGGATIIDLRGELPGHREHQIAVDASFDPNFLPDASGFIFPGHSCAMSLLTDPSTTHVTFKERECTDVDTIGVYMYSGASLNGSDYFVVNADFESDQTTDPGGRDPKPDFGADGHLKVTPMIFDGKNFKPATQVIKPMPFQGDIAVSPSALLLGARFGTKSGAELGYRLSFMKTAKTDAGYTVTTEDAGTVCAKGAKPLFSYDERFMVVHHFADETDFAEYGFASKDDPAFVDLITKGVADLYLIDLSTGQKMRITKMPAGQYALYPNFRADGWLYFLVRDVSSANLVESVMATDAAIRFAAANP